MAIEFVGWDLNVAMQQYGDKWREHRRIVHQQFHIGSLAKYHTVLSDESRKLLRRLLQTPERFIEHTKHLAASVIFKVTFGFETQENNDPWIATADEAMKTFDEVGIVGTYLVDLFPFLRYLPEWAPGSQFKQDAKRMKGSVVSMFREPMKRIQEDIAKGAAKPSIMASLLTELDDSEESTRRKLVIQSAIGTSYAAGTDTTDGALTTFILAMVLYPEVQKKAQAEIDRVIGRDRLPEFADRDSLPYITAITKETLRWHPPLPLGVPHRLMKDDVYNGYQLPAGSIVICNTAAMTRDHTEFPNAHIFDPTRFLTKDGSLNDNASKCWEFSFGAGRRICPGRHFALDTMWIAISAMLATFTMEKSLDKYGDVIEPKEDYSVGTICRVLPFKADIKPRSAAAQALVEALM
ncbi:hypothetical protein PHLGIDRAFT_124262 [Phlebiopsis gigantea 11061_1 CR5-6]|uniref:Cytochrome P450 n=1 Tax=Phlebiopsis gigantea (strain 11061_1 CR5-6) TaxID=745531 RepID=A0A0C3S7F0_PHLG1|nr:hypothetical protein PHLGIDRAFT_124262 [Phlebiopsis gigantea 11061_1 CR5-6]